MNLQSFENKGVSLVPRPFPGKYPTRIRLYTVRGKEFRYEGKPVPGLLSIIRSRFILQRRSLADLNIVEVDQNGVVRSLVGGLIATSVPFADLYFPLSHSVLLDLGRATSVYAMLARNLINIEGHYIYTSSCLATAVGLETTYAAYLRQCARGRPQTVFFNREQRNMMSDALSRATDKWASAPKRIIKLKKRAQPRPAQLHTEMRVAPPAPIWAQPFTRDELQQQAINWQVLLNMNGTQGR